MQSKKNINVAQKPFWETYKAYILSGILAIYALPFSFFYTLPGGTDGGWQRALNEAIKRHFVFGTDFMFTYGPLGYFFTRNLDYVNPVSLLCGDILLFSCFYYVLFQYLSKYNGWFLIILITLFYYKATGYPQSLFLFFIIMSILNIKNDFKKTIELILCAVSGIVVFFVKINYGIVVVLILLLIAGYLLFNNRKSLLIFLCATALSFIWIYSNVNIDLVNYVKYSVPLIAGYNESMQIEIQPKQAPYLSVILYILVFTVTILWYCWKAWIDRTFNYKYPFVALLLSLMFFLMYKNGFTRADGHSLECLTALPFFMVLTMLVTDHGASKKAKTICIFAIFVSDYNLTLPKYENGDTGAMYHATIGPAINYFSTINKKADSTTSFWRLPKDKLQMIGNNTIDILPIDVTTLLLNHLNYDPRPVVQSYSAYDPKLDSLNAYHFFKPSRPEFAMIQIESIDNRYASWDESMTKAVLRLNYDYCSYVSMNNDTELVNNASSYLLLRSNKTTSMAKWPKFEKLYEKEINLEDTVNINFPDDQAIYMTADFEYNTIGKIKNVIYQPAILFVSFFFNEAHSMSIFHRVLRPVLKEPVLINKAICNNQDFKNFETGALKNNMNIKAFAFHAAGRGVKRKIKVAFYKFTNY